MEDISLIEPLMPPENNRKLENLAVELIAAARSFNSPTIVPAYLQNDVP